MADKILIVDDDLDTLRLVGLLLQRKGYEISAADNGRQALQKATEERPDLVLLDIMMPEMDGVEVLRQLRGNAATSDIPIILFTAKSQIEDKVTGFEAGADDYLTKPTHPAELLARVRTVLGRKPARSVPEKEETARKENGRIISVMSAKGGLGVSTVALNIAILLQQSHGDAVLAELRPGFGAIGLMLGVEPPDHLNTLLRKDAQSIQDEDLRQALIEHETGLNLVLSTYQPGDSRYMDAGDQMKAILQRLAKRFNYVIADLGPGYPESRAGIIEISDQVIVITEPTALTVKLTRALLDDLRMNVLGLSSIQVVQVSRTRTDGHLPLGELQNLLGHALATVISPDPGLYQEAEDNHTPITLLRPNSTIAKQYSKLASIVSTA